jgi:hypothetical protein
MNAAPFGVGLGRDAESGLVFGGGDAQGRLNSTSAPPSSPTIDWKRALTLADAAK